MKKLFFLTAAFVCAAVAANAQGWDYARGQQGGYQQQGGYYQQRQYQQQQPAQRQYRQQPAQRQYQQRQQQPVQTQQTPQNGYYQQSQPTQRMQRYNPEVQSGYASTDGYNNRRSQQKNKSFYATPRLGLSITSGTDLDTGVGVAADVAVGMYFAQNFRADFEIGYLFNREVSNESVYGYNYSVDYNEMNFMLNGYYDFNLNSQLTPFIGAGIGLASQELKVKSASVSETNLAITAQGGLSYQISNTMSLEGMARYRYTFCDGDIWDIDFLGGVRFSF